MIRKYGELIGLEKDEPPVKKGFVRIYEFLHGWEDIPEEEYERAINHPLLIILREEIQKEVNREVIRKIQKEINKESS